MSDGVTQPPTVTAPPDAEPHPRPRHALPEAVGGYRVLGVLGTGGMGTVYKAEQRTPVRRTVAVKVVKLGLDTAEVMARFEAFTDGTGRPAA